MEYNATIQTVVLVAKQALKLCVALNEKEGKRAACRRTPRYVLLLVDGLVECELIVFIFFFYGEKLVKVTVEKLLAAFLSWTLEWHFTLLDFALHVQL